jgi:hypothetical protein
VVQGIIPAQNPVLERESGPFQLKNHQGLGQSLFDVVVLTVSLPDFLTVAAKSTRTLVLIVGILTFFAINSFDDTISSSD